MRAEDMRERERRRTIERESFAQFSIGIKKKQEGY